MRCSLRFSLLLLAVLVLALPARRAGSQSSADLQLEKLDSPDPVLPGDSITYEILLTNAGPDAAEFVNLEDTLPAEVTFLSIFADPAWSCSTPPVGMGGTVTCSIDSLPVGVADFFITVMVGSGVAPGTVITNTATASSETPDPDEGGPSATTTTTVAAPPPTADVSVTKVDDPDPVMLGANLTYTITVTNSGTIDATSVSLLDSLPPETTFVSLPVPAGWMCSTPTMGTNGDVLCTIASLAPGSVVFTLTVAVGSGTQILNSAIVSAENDIDESNNTGSATTAVIPEVTVSGTKTVSGTFTPGGAVTYTVVLTNSGPGAQADNAGDEFTDVLPSTLTLVSATATSGTATATVVTNTVTWNGSLAAGASVSITINATINPAVTPGTTISNQGTIAYDADANGANESSAVTDDPSTAPPGDPTSFQVAAEPPPPPPPAEIPALDGLGLAVLAALLSLAGALVLRRRA